MRLAIRLGRIMRIRTNTTLTPSGKVKTRVTVKTAPMLPALRTSVTYGLGPLAVPTRKKGRRTKKKR